MPAVDAMTVLEGPDRAEARGLPPGSASPLGSPTDPADFEEQRLFASVSGRLFGRDQGLAIGRYRVDRRLGAGAMGEVYLGRDRELERPVAIKVVHAHLAGERWAARLRREAKALARLAHPNVVHVYEVGEHGGQLFLVMEYVAGSSLRAWIAAQRPAWHEVLAAYMAAGRGLAAAHGAGLTHRDFKPDNVLRGDDGRILVADFGLASLGHGQSTEGASDDAAEASTEPGSPLTEVRLSRTGEVKGTPAYMPPEQFMGRPVDARADQFAFCVALYEGLWGTRPFAEATLRARIVAMLDGPIVPRERGAVPEWVWPVVARGLAHDASARWPDMDALLAALEAGSRRQRQRRTRAGLGLALGITATAAALAGATLWPGRAPEVAACEEAVAGELDGVWDGSKRRAIDEAFAATGLPIATEAKSRIQTALDGWSSRWLAEQADSCRATRIQGTQSEAMLDRRTVCLQRQRGEMKALVELLAAADDRIVTRVGQALPELPDLGACSVAALQAGAGDEPVVDPVRQGELDPGYEALARAHAQLAVGRPEQATALAGQARSMAKTLGHAPLELEARAVLATVTIESGKLDPGLEELREVVLAAERAELLELSADLRVRLARAAAGDFAEPRLERWLVDDAELALERVARPLDPREVVLQSARARIAEQAGDFPAAIAAHEQAYALAEGRIDDGPRAMLRVGIGTAMYRNGDYAAARAELLQAREAALAAWGQGTPEAAKIEFDLGMVATDLGDVDAARQHLESAIAIDQRVWGTESIEVARDRFALAYLAFGTGEIDQGCEAIADVLAVYEAELGVVHDETASALNASALCRYHAGDAQGAIEGYRRVLAVQHELLGERHHEVGLVHANIGEAELALGDLSASLASYERAYEIMAAALPADHPELAMPIKGRALVWLETGQEARALADLERALELADASQALELAEIRFGLARALVIVNGARDRDRALALSRQALAGFENARIEGRARAVRAWLTDHSGSGLSRG